MIFSELLLRSRKRVYDARDKYGNVITDATVDGIRWSSTQLESSMREALMEFTRDLISLNYKSYYNVSYLYRYITGTAANSSGIVTLVGTDEINDIIRIETSLGTDRYTYTDPDKFFSDEYQNNTLEEESYVFTQVPFSTGAIVIYLLPIPTATIPVRAFCDINLETLFTLTNTSELPIHNVDDLMLDYISRNCNLIEHDMQQFDIMDKVIDKKLQILKARDVKQMGT